jgi:hypothetical protein
MKILAVRIADRDGKRSGTIQNIGRAARRLAMASRREVP